MLGHLFSPHGYYVRPLVLFSIETAKRMRGVLLLTANNFCTTQLSRAFKFGLYGASYASRMKIQTRQNPFSFLQCFLFFNAGKRVAA